MMVILFLSLFLDLFFSLHLLNQEASLNIFNRVVYSNYDNFQLRTCAGDGFIGLLIIRCYTSVRYSLAASAFVLFGSWCFQ